VLWPIQNLWCRLTKGSRSLCETSRTCHRIRLENCRSGCGTDAKSCRNLGDHPYGDQGDHSSWDSVKTKLVVYDIRTDENGIRRFLPCWMNSKLTMAPWAFIRDCGAVRTTSPWILCGQRPAEAKEGESARRSAPIAGSERLCLPPPPPPPRVGGPLSLNTYVRSRKFYKMRLIS